MDIRVDRHPGPPPSENEIIARMREEGKERLGRSQVGGLPRTDPHRINVTPGRKARQPCPQGLSMRMPMAVNTVSNAAVNLASRSRIENFRPSA